MEGRNKRPADESSVTDSRSADGRVAEGRDREFPTDILARL